MNKEEIIKGKVQIKNKWFETREDELDIALNVIDDLLVYINQLETNWNELKDWLKVCLEENNKIRLYDNNSYQAGEINTLENVIDKIKELEGGSNE